MLDVIGSSVTDILMLAYRGLTMVMGATSGAVVFVVTSNVIVIATSSVTVLALFRYCFVVDEIV